MSLTELEIRIAHIELSLQTLSEELARQQRRQNALDVAVALLQERLAASLEPGPDAADEPPPPHY